MHSITTMPIICFIIHNVRYRNVCVVHLLQALPYESVCVCVCIEILSCNTEILSLLYD